MTSWPADVPAASFSELQQSLLTGRFALGVAKDHAKDWWTLRPESRGRLFARIFLLFPLVLAAALVAAAVATGNWTWLIALPLGFLAMPLGSPMNPGRFIAVLLGLGLLVAGWLLGWSSLVVSGTVVLMMYAEMQMYYWLGKRAFRRFLITDAAGFAKYWNAGIVWLSDNSTGRTYNHDFPEPDVAASGVAPTRTTWRDDWDPAHEVPPKGDLRYPTLGGTILVGVCFAVAAALLNVWQDWGIWPWLAFGLVYLYLIIGNLIHVRKAKRQ